MNTSVSYDLILYVFGKGEIRDTMILIATISFALGYCIALLTEKIRRRLINA